MLQKNHQNQNNIKKKSAQQKQKPKPTEHTKKQNQKYWMHYWRILLHLCSIQ